MPDELIVAAIGLAVQVPTFVLVAWKIRQAPVRRVVTDERELSALGSRARLDETLKIELAARAYRQESTGAWNAAGKPS